MTVTLDIVDLRFNCDGATTVFPLADLVYLDKTDLQVWLVAADGSAADWTLGNQFNLTGDGTVGAGILTTTAVDPYDAPFEIYVLRGTDDIQNQTFRDGDGFPSANVGNGFDRRTLRSQEMGRKFDMAISASPTDAPRDMTLPALGEMSGRMVVIDEVSGSPRGSVWTEAELSAILATIVTTPLPVAAIKTVSLAAALAVGLTLQQADAAAAAAGYILDIDADHVPGVAISFAASVVRFSAGVATLGNFDFTFGGCELQLPLRRCFNVNGTGRLRGKIKMRRLSPEHFGAVGGVRASNNCNIGNGSHTLDGGDDVFTASDVGKIALVWAGGAAGVDLQTTITAVAGGDATLAAAAGTAVVNGICVWGAQDDIVYINQALAAAYELQCDFAWASNYFFGAQIVPQPGGSFRAPNVYGEAGSDTLRSGTILAALPALGATSHILYQGGSGNPANAVFDGSTILCTSVAAGAATFEFRDQCGLRLPRIVAKRGLYLGWFHNVAGFAEDCVFEDSEQQSGGRGLRYHRDGGTESFHGSGCLRTHFRGNSGTVFKMDGAVAVYNCPWDGKISGSAGPIAAFDTAGLVARTTGTLDVEMTVNSVMVDPATLSYVAHERLMSNGALNNDNGQWIAEEWMIAYGPTTRYDGVNGSFATSVRHRRTHKANYISAADLDPCVPIVDTWGGIAQVEISAVGYRYEAMVACAFNRSGAGGKVMVLAETMITDVPGWGAPTAWAAGNRTIQITNVHYTLGNAVDLYVDFLATSSRGTPWREA